jgi:hypothetical protein
VAAIQHAGARKLLDIIASAGTNDELPSYKTAAKLLGRPESIPALLLKCVTCLTPQRLWLGYRSSHSLRCVTVRERSTQRLGKKTLKHRNSILERSKNHRFTAADFKAISRALMQLEGRGNRAAWRYARRQPGFVEPFRNPNRFDFGIQSRRYP